MSNLQILLLVDDEPNILSALKRVFDDEGYLVLTANSAEEGLKILAENPVQVIISDQRMPNMTGAEFLSVVKNQYPDTIRIILSAYSEFDSIKTAINKGAIYKFFNKPWDEKELLQGVQSAFLLNKQQKEKELQLGRLRNFAKVMGLSVGNISDSDAILTSDLPKAIKRKELIVHYQPILSVATNEICGAEALIYWQHPTHGLLSPHKFISLAEQTGSINPITKWVIDTSLRQLKTWLKQINPDFFLAINISAYPLKLPDFSHYIDKAIKENELPPHLVDLEITESIIINQTESNLTILNDLKKIGVLLSIDDFGTGFSSLSYLQQFPFDIIKIDKSFLQHIVTDNTSKEIVKIIIELAKNLNKKVVAEGIENKKQLEFLKEKNCHFFQGFIYSPPLSAEKFEELLNTQLRS